MSGYGRASSCSSCRALTTPGALEWWAKRQSWFTSAFQAHVAEVLPTEALETLKGFEQAIVGKVFMGGVLIETGTTGPGNTGTGDRGPGDTETVESSICARCGKLVLIS